MAGGERIERPKPASKTGGFPLTEPPSSQWGDRRESNSRSWSHNPTPQPLGHGHIWCLRERSNLRVRLFRPALVHLSYAGEFGGDGENRTLIGWVQASHPPVERRPHGCGGGNRTHLMAAYETAVCSSSSSPHQNWSGKLGSNQLSVAAKKCAILAGRKAPVEWLRHGRQRAQRELAHAGLSSEGLACCAR